MVANTPKTKISIIIPVRNEIKNMGKLLQDIDSQTYSYSLFEVIVVNDGSTDGTFEYLNSMTNKLKFELTILNLEIDDKRISPKKAAITKAINIAKGHLIITTDGDCRVGENWLNSFANFYETKKPKLISGPVTFYSENSVFNALQIVEFSSLIGVGAASIQLKRPNMCNGANLAYEKAVFYEVNGFEGFEEQPSGDDEFLMHKIAKKYPNQIAFLKNREAIVTTNSQESVQLFINQRKRWASKWSAYANISNSILAVFIFLVNLSIVFTFFFLALNNFFLLLFSALVIKFIIEWAFIGSVLVFLKKKNHILFIPLVQIIYPFYVAFVALASWQKGYVWKGRVLK